MNRTAAAVLAVLLLGCAASGETPSGAVEPEPAVPTADPTPLVVTGRCASNRENAGVEFTHDGSSSGRAAVADEVCGPVSVWKTSRTSDALTGKIISVAWSDAITHDLEHAYSGTPSLGVVCEDGFPRIEVWLGGEIVIGAGRLDIVDVLYRFDDGDPVDDRWFDEPEHKSAVLNWPSIKPFLRGLRTSDSLMFRVWNFDDTVIGTLTFDLSGVERDVEPVLQECGY